eukprot:TRINITY_DN2302_c0_g7_i2.p1 TRINITY_DN2302_c0_g7~~TRINITY_DN2302_c0_g7_i2.p1  ORF type:complete len:325 (+),score=41.30 TRINITY_DN2302_c0_g7_i2:313-1287(+)
MSRSAQLGKVYEELEEGSKEALSEDEGYDKYGHPRYLHYPVLSSLLGAVLITLFILAIELPLLGNSENSIEMHFVILTTFTLFVGSICQLVLLVKSFQSVGHLYENITITFELIIVLVTYFLILGAFNILIILTANEFNLKLFSEVDLRDIVPACATMLLIRNVVWITVTVFFPIKRRNKFFVIEYSENPECSRNIEVALCSKIGYAYFAKFICEKYYPNGCELLNLFCLLMIWKEKEIYGKNIVEIEEEIKKFYNTSQSIKNTIHFTKDYVHLMKIVLKRLKAHYSEFRYSSYYKKLNRALKRKQIINERLRFANLICAACCV